MKKKIFISYSRKDRDYVQELVKRLNKDGLETFVDFQDLKSGASWGSIIENAIESSSVFLFILSNNWANSDSAIFELGAAYGKGKKIIPILIGTEPEKIPLQISMFQFIDGREKNINEVSKIVEEIIEK